MYIGFSSMMKTKLQTLNSPDNSHKAKLVRIRGIDRNYIVFVDDQEIYGSPDFSAREDIPFRETLLWDRSGKVLLLEIAGHRIFGYDTSRARKLSDSELLAVEAAPEPPLSEYGFEGEWPGIGHAWRTGTAAAASKSESAVR